MTTTQMAQALAQIKKGQFVKVRYITNGKNGYSKETATLVRFVEYANIKGVQAKGKANPNETYSSNGFIIHNANTNKDYIQMAVVNGHKGKTIYKDGNGNEIDKTAYEQVNPPRNNAQPLVVFRKCVSDIISLG